MTCQNVNKLVSDKKISFEKLHKSILNCYVISNFLYDSKYMTISSLMKYRCHFTDQCEEYHWRKEEV